MPPGIAAIVSLTLAKEFYSDLDVEAYSAKVDEIVQGVKALTKDSTDPDYRVRALNTYLFKRRGIEYDLSDPNVQKPENRHLNGILDTNKVISSKTITTSISFRTGAHDHRSYWAADRW